MGYADFSSKTKNIICKCAVVIPTQLYLKLLYRIKTGRKLHLKRPKTYSEKINWLKVYDRNPLYTRLVDKYEVRDYVEKKIGNQYLIPLLGVWDTFEEIDFAALPEKFVLKCTHDFGSVAIVEDKDSMNREEVRKMINDELKYNFYYRGREWAYKDVKPRVIAETFMSDGKERLTDYKFFCFGGKVKFMFIATGRGSDLRFDFFSRDFQHLDVTNGVPNADVVPEKPRLYDKMIEIAEKLSEGIDNVRVDLYEIENKIYFSEMTFYHNGGMVAFDPYEADVQLGQSFIMKKK
ncbi:MAG: glycosyl transferase [Oscillospiraceae bacterium]|nr:glycosyl transferase [Oscillospiraceae bacterium]